MLRQRLLTLVTLLAVIVFSQSAVAENRYQVEIIVFEHLHVNSSETWSADESRPQWQDALTIFDGNADNRFTALSPGSYKMGGVYRVLRSAQGYRPILHLAWEQTGLPASRARPVFIDSDGGQVEGELELEQSRFLHVNLDLIYPFGGSEGRFARIQERRRLKLKELHYFDNPVFGVIVQVTRAGE